MKLYAISSDGKGRAAIWVQAIYWDMIMNAYKRTGDERYKTLIKEIYQGGYEQYSAYDWTDEIEWFIYDDMMWWIISLGRAYQITGDPCYLADASSGFFYVWKESYDEKRGGMWWNFKHDAKMACINFPTIVGAMTLYECTKNKSYLEKAMKLYDWSRKVFLDAKQGSIADNIHYHFQRPNGMDVDWTTQLYNQGTFIGSAVMLYKATKEKRYLDDAILAADYVKDRFTFLAEVAPHFRRVLEKEGDVDPQMKQILTPHALDDAGAVCAAMIKAMQKDPSLKLNGLIENYMDFILNKEYRLADGTFARTRPQHNTLWLDDMFMGIPPVAYYSYVAAEKKESYMAEALRQIFQFAERMWVPEKKLFRHGWVEGMQDHPAFHWGRANGWALLTMCEVLDVLPEDYPQRDKLLELFRAHVRGLAACQSGEGFWHQLLDRNDSYLETSATAIYVYCFAHAINKGWIDAMAYGPVAQLGWHAVSTQINEEGQVDGTCVGTGMAFDPAFYYYRPVNVYAAHGYGPVIWAGAEMIKMLGEQHPKMNDSAVQYYRTEQKTNEPIFHVTDGGK